MLPTSASVDELPADTAFFCTTHVEATPEPQRATTVGVRFDDARWFRGRETDNRESSFCPDPMFCSAPSRALASRWEEKVIVSARSQERILGLMAPDPYPELDMPKVLAVVQGHSTD